MIDLEQEMQNEEFPAEMREFLRQTLPNLGFYFLMERAILRINQDMTNLDTSCTDEKFVHKYDKLVLERDIYLQLKRVAEKLAASTSEEL